MNKIYTTLDKPESMRKDLLRSNIKIIEIMENLEDLKELRNNKHNTYLFLKAYIKEIHAAISKLKSSFPGVEYDDKEEELQKEIENINLEFKGYVKKEKDIEKLERELFSLKEKLKGLN